MDPSLEPPDLDGFSYEATLGSGGFADVYRYRQRFPRRSVAIKILRTTTANRPARRAFIAEGNAMAELSGHPAIASVYSAGVTDDNRPYLVMEYCSRGSMGTAYRTTPVPVDEALRIGVRIASALESAHRAGIVHRDVKPANILITAYGAAVLSDFGISAVDAPFAEASLLHNTLGSTSSDSGSVGLSVPWAPPEALADEPVVDARSDIYSLAATLFTLVEGRSPFEIVGGANGVLPLSRRIERGEIVPGERMDAVPALSGALRTALATHPGDRPQSALEFAEQLVQIQGELGHARTPIELLDDAPAADVAPESESESESEQVPEPDPQPELDETVIRERPVPDETTKLRPQQAEPSVEQATERKPKARTDAPRVIRLPRRGTVLMFVALSALTLLAAYAFIVRVLPMLTAE